MDPLNKEKKRKHHVISQTHLNPLDSYSRKKYSNLVLCGGGSKCIAFCGAIKYLENFDMLPSIERIIGTSAGALIGLLLILNYSPAEIDDEIEILDGKKIFGPKNNITSFSFTSLPQIIYNLWYYNGINSGKYYHQYLKSVFSRKGLLFNITFKELYDRTKKDYTIVATRLNDSSMVIFNHIKTPNLSVIDALRASTCIPFIFYPIKLGDYLYVDGGLKNNFPLSLVPKKGNTIALRLEIDYEDCHLEEMTSIGFLWFVGRILDSLFSNSWADESYIRRKRNIDIFRIKVPNISFIDFDINSHTKQILRNAGYDILNHNLLDRIN